MAKEPDMQMHVTSVSQLCFMVGTAVTVLPAALPLSAHPRTINIPINAVTTCQHPSIGVVAVAGPSRRRL